MSAVCEAEPEGYYIQFTIGHDSEQLWADADSGNTMGNTICPTEKTSAVSTAAKTNLTDAKSDDIGLYINTLHR